MKRRRRTQPDATVEPETVTLRLSSHLVRTIDPCAKYLGGSTDRTHVITQALRIALTEDADPQKTLSAGRAAPAGEPVAATTCAMSRHLDEPLIASGGRPAPPTSPPHTPVSADAPSANVRGKFSPLIRP